MSTNANASLRWLAGDSPNLAEAREAVRRIVRDGNRASGVIARMRALFKKAAAAKEPVDINEISPGSSRDYPGRIAKESCVTPD